MKIMRMPRTIHILSGLVIAFCVQFAQPVSNAFSPEEEARIVEQGLDHFYNHEFMDAIQYFERLRDGDPERARWQNYVGMGYFYEQLNEAGSLESDLFGASNRFFKKNITPDPALSRPFLTANQLAIEACETGLEEDHQDQESLYSCGVAYAARSAYQGLIERSLIGALASARKANNFHTQLLDLDERHYDAYLIPGLYDFVTGSLPRAARFLFFFAGLNGDKQRGIRLIEVVSKWGVSSRHDARILLTVAYRREKRYADARQVIGTLAETFPRNYIFPLEVASLHRAADEIPEAISGYENVLRKALQGAPGFDRAPVARIHFELGVLYQDEDDPETARRHFEQVAGSAGVTDELAEESRLNITRIEQELRQRQEQAGDL